MFIIIIIIINNNNIIIINRQAQNLIRCLHIAARTTETKVKKKLK